jgi:hypothetical protein
MIRKDKVFELKIEEDDDVSGIDSISLVDEPAIDVMWVAFAKEQFQEVDVYGYKTKYFYICPGAVATFEHLISMDNDDDTIGMIRSAAVVADSIFKIEDDVLKAKVATEDQLDEASILVDDFKDIIEEIDEISGMQHDVSYMDGHIETIASYVKENMESVSDYPESISNNAKRGIELNEKNNNKCATQVGKVRAQQLANGEPISLQTIKRMYSYLSRASEYYDESDTNACGTISYLLWGGKSALSWAESKLNDFGYDVSTITGYVDPDIKKKRKKIIEKAVAKPTLFSDDSDKKAQYFAADSEKQMVLGPAMIPNQKIFRKNQDGTPYYVFFSPETIKMIASKYMKNKYIDNNDQMHDGQAVKDVYVVESWIKESNNDKSTDYGFGDLPVGTWFVSMKINNSEIWSKVKNNELNGFSVSGFFEEVAAFKREEMFLQKVADILANIKD